VPDGQQELAFRDHRKEWGRQWDTLDHAKDHEQLFAYILAEGEVELRNKLLSDPLGSKSGSSACKFSFSRFPKDLDGKRSPFFQVFFWVQKALKPWLLGQLV
jgi:hypothetical protein